VRAVVVALLGLVTLSAQEATFRSAVEAVRVDVLALKDDKPVTGLTASDFELRDDGVVQRIDAMSVEDEPLRVMLALDLSGSVEGQALEHLREAAAAVINLLSPNDRAAVLTFSGAVAMPVGWTADRASLIGALERAHGAGATALYDATYAALLSRDTEPGRTLLLLFSDGDDTASWLSGDAVLDVARRTETVVYAVEARTKPASSSVGFRVDFASGVPRGMPRLLPPLLLERFLPALTSETGGKYVDADSTVRLRDMFVRILREFRTRYVITYTPAGVDREGWHPIEIRVKGRRAKVIARRGYLR